MTNKYKLVVSDIDGTLTNVRGEISSTDMATLHRIEQSGVRLAVSTGRAAKGSMPILQMLPAASGFHIFFDGALVCNTALNESIYSRPIEKSLLSGAIELAHTHGLALELFSPDGYCVEADDPLAAAHRDLMRLDWTVCDFTTLCESESIIMGCLVVPTVE